MILTVMFGFAFSVKAQRLWTYVVVETAVSRADAGEDSDEPDERRFYVSEVVEVPESVPDYNVSKTADAYFMKNIVEPLKAKGINHEYYDDGVEVNCGSVLAVKDKQDAEAKRAACIADLKEQGSVNIYSFIWTFGAAKGLATTRPTLIFRGQETPNYQPR